MKELIKDFNVSELIPYDKNPRKNKDAVKEVIKSIKKTGNNDPIEINEDNVILAGHTRLLALQEMGIKKTDVIKISGLTKEKQKQYRVLNNKTGEFAEWDFELLEADFNVDELIEFGFENEFEINFDNIKSTENREKTFKEQLVTCSKCGNSFTVKI